MRDNECHIRAKPSKLVIYQINTRLAHILRFAVILKIHLIINYEAQALFSFPFFGLPSKSMTADKA